MSITKRVHLPLSRFPETDGIPMDSAWQRDEIGLLINTGRYHNRHRDDFYLAGNLFIYYDPTNPRKAVGPDFFYVNGRPRFPTRPIWAVWMEEGRFPDMITELISRTSKKKDLTKNKEIYEKIFQTPEYYVYDPGPRELRGWRLSGSLYQPIEPGAQGRLWSEQMGLWLGPWTGVVDGEPDVWLRFFDPQGRLVLLPAEAERQRAEAERQRGESERRQAEAERQRADAEKQRAEMERRQAEAERQRAEAAELEVARLKRLLGEPGLP